MSPLAETPNRFHLITAILSVTYGVGRQQESSLLSEAFQTERIIRAVDSCGCGLSYSPVCGVDAQTYGNACIAKCMNQNVASQGPCKPCTKTGKGGKYTQKHSRSPAKMNDPSSVANHTLGTWRFGDMGVFCKGESSLYAGQNSI